MLNYHHCLYNDIKIEVCKQIYYRNFTIYNVSIIGRYQPKLVLAIRIRITTFGGGDKFSFSQVSRKGTNGE